MKVFYPGTQTGYHIIGGKHGLNLKPGENELSDALGKAAIASGLCRAIPVKTSVVPRTEGEALPYEDRTTDSYEQPTKRRKSRRSFLNRDEES